METLDADFDREHIPLVVSSPLFKGLYTCLLNLDSMEISSVLQIDISDDEYDE